jgi:RNA-directed DNA polymerase
VNTGASWPSPEQATVRVSEIQTKLHRWARADGARRFDDLFNLVADPAFLVVAWTRVRGNTGARSPGVDGQTARVIEQRVGVEAFLQDVRDALRSRTFEPLPVRERMIPKPGTRKRRRLGIPTVTDRVVQAALKLVLEPIFEADFKPCSYGFRPRRRPHDAIAEVHQFTSRGYVWVLEADIEACFDNIDHLALLARVRDRVGDKRVVPLVKAFLKAGILSEDLVARDTNAGTPQGGILSPLLANIALSVLDEHFDRAWHQHMGTRPAREARRRRGLPTYRLIRYADDFIVVVHGTRDHAEGLRGEVEEVLAPMGLRLSEAKTSVVHIDEGFDFLGFRIRRHHKEGDRRSFVYTYPAKKALASIKRKVRTITRQGTHHPLGHLLRQLRLVLRGWCNYFRHGVSSRTFGYLAHFTWTRVVCWLRRKHRKVNWKQLRRRYLSGYRAWWPTDGTEELFDPNSVPVTRYRYRGQQIPTPWDEPAPPQAA